MKKLILIAAFAVSGLVSAQSNQEGVVNFGLNGGLAIGSTKTATDSQTTFGGSYGLWGQYGLDDNFSAGINLGYGAYVSTFSNSSFNSTNNSIDENLTWSGFEVTLEGRYYAVNRDNFNFFLYPNVGFASRSNDFIGVGLNETKTTVSGLSFGAGIGINYYLTELLGGNIKIGYQADPLSSGETKANFSGVIIQGGLSFKLD